MRKLILLGVIYFSCLYVTVKADDYQDAFRVYKEYLGATMAKQLGMVMDRLDKSSPTYNAEVKNAAEGMINTDIVFKIISKAFVGQSGEYLVIRVMQQNLSKNADPNVKGVEVDALQIFKKTESGVWKYRNAQILFITQISG